MSSHHTALHHTRTHTTLINWLQDVPVLKPFYTDFETNFHALPFVNFSERYWNYAFVICAVYLVSDHHDDEDGLTDHLVWRMGDKALSA